MLGFSLGKKKQSGTQNSVLDSVTDLTGSQTQSSVQSGTTTTNTSGTTSSTGTQSGTTTQDQSQSQSGTQRTTGITTNLGADVINSLSETVKSVLGRGITDANLSGLSEMIAGRQGFDADQFVADTVAAARNRGEQTLQEQNSAFASRVGGTVKTNSMAALLEQRGRNDLEANLAGIRAQATGQAEGIENQNLATAVGAQQGVGSIGAALAEALKGGTTTTDMTSLTDQISQLIGRGSSMETSQQNTSASETTATNQLLAQIAEVLTQQREQQKQTEDVTSKGKSGGFGLSVGI